MAKTRCNVPALLAAMAFIVVPAAAGHWVEDPDLDPGIKAWYQGAVRSDTTPETSPCRQVPLDDAACRRGMPSADNHGTGSCCGPADSYYADRYVIKGAEFYAVVTDDRVVEGRPVVPVGTEIRIPQIVLDVYHQGNPTGHVILFLASGQYPICYFFSTGG